MISKGLEDSVLARALAFETKKVTLRQATVLRRLSRLAAESVGLALVVIDSTERSFSGKDKAGNVSSSVQSGEPSEKARKKF